jgi:hypothetical protein|tara:strand:+ start:1307 stop:1582 length:276 start_codon:yes stop_codon:yes gene_type:complete
MTNTRRFDRHENMDSETRGEIMDLIIKFKLSEFGDFDLVNSLYGLFDGYFYEDTLKKHQKVIEVEDVTLGIRLANVIKEVGSYPEGVTQIF